jgi:hypothetical protein
MKTKLILFLLFSFRFVASASSSSQTEAASEMFDAAENYPSKLQARFSSTLWEKTTTYAGLLAGTCPTESTCSYTFLTTSWYRPLNGAQGDAISDKIIRAVDGGVDEMEVNATQGSIANRLLQRRKQQEALLEKYPQLETAVTALNGKSPLEIGENDYHFGNVHPALLGGQCKG